MADVTEKTKIPVRWAAGLVLCVITCTVWLNSSLNNLEGQITGVSYELKTVKDKVEQLSAKRWTIDDQALFEERLKNLNPTLVLPPRLK